MENIAHEEAAREEQVTREVNEVGPSTMIQARKEAPSVVTMETKELADSGTLIGKKRKLPLIIMWRV